MHETEVVSSSLDVMCLGCSWALWSTRKCGVPTSNFVFYMHWVSSTRHERPMDKSEGMCICLCAKCKTSVEIFEFTMPNELHLQGILFITFVAFSMAACVQVMCVQVMCGSVPRSTFHIPSVLLIFRSGAALGPAMGRGQKHPLSQPSPLRPLPG